MRSRRALPQARTHEIRQLPRPHLRRSLLRRPRARAENLPTSMTKHTPLTALSCKPNLRAPVLSPALAGTRSPRITTHLTSSALRSPARRCLRPTTFISINRYSSSDRGSLSPARVGDGNAEWSPLPRHEAALSINGLGVVQQPLAWISPTWPRLSRSMDMTPLKRRSTPSPTTGKS